MIVKISPALIAFTVPKNSFNTSESISHIQIVARRWNLQFTFLS